MSQATPFGVIDSTGGSRAVQGLHGWCLNSGRIFMHTDMQ
jgi:hypothetical protein